MHLVMKNLGSVDRVRTQIYATKLQLWLVVNNDDFGLGAELVLIGLPCFHSLFYPALIDSILRCYQAHFKIKVLLHGFLSLIWVCKVFPETELVVQGLL